MSLTWRMLNVCFAKNRIFEKFNFWNFLNFKFIFYKFLNKFNFLEVNRSFGLSSKIVVLKYFLFLLNVLLSLNLFNLIFIFILKFTFHLQKDNIEILIGNGFKYQTDSGFLIRKVFRLKIVKNSTCSTI